MPDRFLADDAAAIAALSQRADQLLLTAAPGHDRDAVAEGLAPVRALEGMLADGDPTNALRSWSGEPRNLRLPGSTGPS